MMIVIKIGGAEGISLDALCSDLAMHIHEGQKIVVTHGGSSETNTLSTALGHPPRFITSPSGHQSRYTDRQTLEIFMMAVAGKVNKLIVEHLQRLCVNAIGLSGLDGRLLEGTRKTAIKAIENGKRRIIRDDWSGKVETVNAGLLQLLMSLGYTPVVSPLMASRDGEAVNVDADRAAAAIAIALKAERLILLSNVQGLLKDVNDPASLIGAIPGRCIGDFEPCAKGRMKKKLLAAKHAFTAGVREVVLADARVETPVSDALRRKGTVIQ